MTLLLIYLGTVIGSIVIKAISILGMCKDIADMGYKLDLDYYKGKKDDIINEFTVTNNKLLLIPIYNLYKVLNDKLNYNQSREEFLNNLWLNPLFKPLNDFEAEDYLNKQTGLNALLVPIKFNLRLSKALFLDIKKDDIEGRVYYEKTDEGDIIILDVTGNVNKLSLEEQEDIIYEYWVKVLYEGLKEYGGLEKLATNKFKLNSNNLDNEMDISEMIKFIEEKFDKEEIAKNNEGPKLKRKR